MRTLHVWKSLLHLQFAISNGVECACLYIYTYNNLHNQTHTLRQFEAVLEAVFEAGIPRCCEEGPIIFCVVWTWLNGMIGVYVICYMLPSTWDHIPLDRQYFDPKGALSTVGLLVTRLHVELLAKTSCRYCRLQMTPDWNKMCSKGDQYPIYIHIYIYIFEPSAEGICLSVHKNPKHQFCC